MSTNRGELAVLEALTRSFYDVVPLQFRTYCATTAKVAHGALKLLGIRSALLPCQLMYAGPRTTYIIGFTGTGSAGRPKWDGHVVCASDDWIIDAALHHLHAEFGVKVPDIACRQRLQVPSQALCRLDLSPTERLWWHNPPTGFDTTLPREPEDVVAAMCRELAAHVQQKLDADARQD